MIISIHQPDDVCLHRYTAALAALGKPFASGLELRAELPVLVAFSAPGEASTVVPTLIVTAGYRFK